MACIGRNVEILINLPKNLAKCSCIPQCAELNYYSHTKKIIVRDIMILTILSVLYSALYYLCLFLINLLTVLPLGIDVGLFGVAAYFTTKLKRPDPENVSHIFGPEHGSKEGDSHPERILKCIAHRGAGLDAPENTLEAFKYCLERDCNFVELDVRTSKDGQLVLLHDRGLERLTGANISNGTL
ncbi:unnamed protein product [Leptidea sinapis]|uniref:GP-PDE domain-containing protein n=1 Tax=Leptidea sinapis TaxID=189913 RepID=A0A5E4QVH1_9NEOP|nr:unnamed protein product [Leptidea sinapis]